MRSREKSSGEHERDALGELATLLARAFLRLPESARRVAISDAEIPRDRLDVSALPRPHVDGSEAA